MTNQILHDMSQCEGHPAGPFDPMGETVFCDGSCASIDEPPAPEMSCGGRGDCCDSDAYGGIGEPCGCACHS